MVSQETIAKTLWATRKDSVTGPDYIAYRMIEVAAAGNKSTIVDLFTNLLRHGAYPPEWKIDKCLPIPKPGKSDLGSPKSLRPILLLSCVVKYFK